MVLVVPLGISLLDIVAIDAVIAVDAGFGIDAVFTLHAVFAFAVVTPFHDGCKKIEIEAHSTGPFARLLVCSHHSFIR